MDYAEHYRDLATDLPGQDLPWLRSLRQQAEAVFSQHGFPSPREEAWRYTNVTPIEKKRFLPLTAHPSEPDCGELLARYRLPEAWVLVFVDGLFSAGHSDLAGLPGGVLAMPMAEALAHHPDRVRASLQAESDGADSRFVDFTNAYFRDGAFLHIGAGIALPRPVQLLHLSTRPEGLSVLRHAVILEHHAEASVIETYAGEDSAGYLTSTVTSLHLGEGARLEHGKFQVESPRSYHFASLVTTQQAASQLRQQHLAFGGLIARTDIHSWLGRDTDCTLDGLFMVSGRRHLDTHFLLRHGAPHARSRAHYRGIAAERGRGVFAGRIVVDAGAEKTDADMSSRNLLLSEDAEIDCQPQLEILTDDVKCSHGVTIGQLEAEAVFYLQSRGLDEVAARNTLTFAFANEQVEKIRLATLRQQVRDTLLRALPQADIRADWL